MTDARTAFQDTLAQLTALTYPCDDGFSFRFSVEYLKRGRICYQFRGRSCSGLADLAGYRINMIGGGMISALPGNAVVAAIDAFEDNAVIAFYVGGKFQTGAITTELLAMFATMPEVLLIELETIQAHDRPSHASLTRLALVGFEQGTAGSSPPDESYHLCVDDLLHPYWCHDRYMLL
ncbi:hypothetical protein HFO10_24630 [Rhizobium laguerreae]|uniref:hypothetical protein n=1 Tax=Rhizobium laguerreae TaxID=1076926 RepID=UPI001C91E638|nr:hypothetical protein [Rhizobium laguerreae]MBY3299065.1 hypothetical protein [Rhizobium laguerreae]